jgi:uncharacterized membrane protein
VIFLGRFHFIFLHLPIGLVLMALTIELAGVLPPLRAARAAVPLTLWCASLGAIAATICGFLLSRTGGYGAELLQLHQWTGIGVAVGTVLTLALKLVADRRRDEGARGLQALYLCSLVIVVGLVTAAGHYGGSMTHGRGYLTKYMPPELQALLGWENEPEVAGVRGQSGAAPAAKDIGMLFAYAEVIQPIFEKKCWGCHGEEKAKGKYRMDSFALMMTPGESEMDAIVPGDPESSELYYRITTDDEDDIMPPDDKEPLTEREIALIRWWISNGADEEKRVGELERTDAIDAILNEIHAARTGGGGVASVNRGADGPAGGPEQFQLPEPFLRPHLAYPTTNELTALEAP